MKRILKENRKYLILFFVITSLTFLFGCNGITPTSPIINSFSANVYILDEGDSATLSWTVTEATTVTINQGIGSVALTGSTSVTPVATTTYTLNATNSAGSSIATVTITVNPAIVEQTSIIQPGPSEGKDSYVSSLLPSSNYASNQYLSIGKSTFSTIEVIRANYIYEDYYLKAFIQFDLSDLPDDAVIVSADLKLFQFGTSGAENFMIALHQVTESWEENMITWNNQPDYLSSPESISPVTAGATTWLSWDITFLLQGWLDGEIPNYGVVLKNTDEPLGDTYIYCCSSDYTDDPNWCPKLEITYYVP